MVRFQFIKIKFYFKKITAGVSSDIWHVKTENNKEFCIKRALNKLTVKEDNKVVQRYGEKETLSKVLAYSNCSSGIENSALLSILDITDKQSYFSLSCSNDEESILTSEPLSYPSQSIVK